jgi:hypothetical protein
LSVLLLTEYKKQVNWKATRKDRTEITPTREEVIRTKIETEMKRQLMIDEFAKKVEQFNPETCYVVQDRKDNYDFMPSCNKEFVVNSDRIRETVHSKSQKQKRVPFRVREMGPKIRPLFTRP